jgi:membrane-associated protease RseP (regulator of RpoE activity)
VYRDDQLVFESRTMDDTIAPEWNEDLPHNIEIPPDCAFRLEVWDRDAVGADPVGIYRGHGRPPNALPGVDARILLEGESYLTIHLDEPHAHRGIGISGFEVHGSELVVISVEEHSPAGRAGIVPGDRITAIGGRAVSELGQQQATGALSMAAERHQNLSVISSGQTQAHEVELDHGYVWLTM